MEAISSTTKSSGPCTVPKTTKILIIGGGPAGSYAAAVLSREGFDVVLLEATKFPRYHIGESLLASVRPFLKFIGAEEEVKAHGFTNKPGGAAKLNQYKREGYSDFIETDPDSGAFQVIRSEFDDILLRHAEKCGAKVIQETQVTDIHFSPKDPTQPISASYVRKSKSVDGHSGEVDGGQGEIKFDYLIDASGRRGIMSTRYLKNRKFNQTLKNIAVWGYWTGVKKYMAGTAREGAIWVEALTDESGWVWYIPLHDGSTSVGIVVDEATYSRKKAESGLGLQDFYISQLNAFTPETLKLIGEGTLRGKDGPGAVKSASDYSYSAPTYSGNHFRIAGDAGAFIDPFFSSGVHLAFTGGLSAAVTTSASIKGHTGEEEACKWHDAKVSTSYTRFLLVVSGIYKQVRNQSATMMSDIGEDNFDRAFEAIRPVIQGTFDVGKVLPGDELQKAMDLLIHIFGPVDPDMQHAVLSRIDPKFVDPSAPILTQDDLNNTFSEADEDAKIVLANLNAWKPLGPLLQPSKNFGGEPHHGRVAILETGELSLS